MTQTISLSKTLLEHAAAIQRMKSKVLSLDWLKAYSIPQLMACCDRMDAALPGVNVTDKTLQRELIRNPAFAAYCAKLLPLFPEDPPVEKAPEPAYGSRRYYSAPATPPSPRTACMAALYGLLESCFANGTDITAFPPERLMEVLALEGLADDARLAYLVNFSTMELSDEARQTAAAGLRRCIGVPLALTAPQKALLLEPFVADRELFAAAPFGEIWALLDGCLELLDIIRLLHDHRVRENLTLDDYRAIAPDTAEHYRLLSVLVPRLGADAVSLFMDHWRRNGCPLYELRTMERRTAEHPDADWPERIFTLAGYVNQLYGSRFKAIDLSSVSSYQEDILVYAITHNKKHFIRLVDEHAETFLYLPNTSALFQEALYREHFNLNELTASDLAAFTRMNQRQLNVKFLIPGRRYTFPELRELCGQSSRYLQLYHALQSDSQDYRLRVFRQVCKRGVLPPDMEEASIAALAASLDRKPLDAWTRTDFGHIDGLTAGDAALLLAHLDAIRHVLPSIQTRADALLVLRNVDALGQYASMAELKDSLLHTDADWLALVKRMDLPPEFQEQHRESIIRFLCGNGAYIAETYANGLNGKQRTAFLRVVKAELMGQLADLKYYEGDLQRELDSPLTARVRSRWRENLSLAKGGLEVREHDDFFSTMLLGVQPQRTCMSYIDGQYKECLLSAFDSNKKILYATLDGRVVGRAFLRLTKGRLTGADVPADDSGFTFVDLEQPDARPARPREREGLALFLERPYISGAGPDVSRDIIRMFVELAERKANELDTMLVLSADYRSHVPSGFTWTKYAVYISKSKAGAQYLDSLGGQATVSAEGSYRANSFLVREAA